MKQMEKSLETLMLVASRTTDVIIITDASGYITYVNEAYEKLTEYSAEEAIGRRPGHLVQGPDTDPATVNRINKAVASKKTIREEVLNYSKSGRKYWESVTIDPVFNEDNVCIAFIAINKEITDRKRLEAELNELQEFLFQTSKMARVAGWNLTVEDKYLTSTSIVCEILELDPGHVLTFESAISFYKEGENRDVLIKAVEEAMTNGKPFDLELLVVTNKGKELWTRTIGNTEIKNGKCTRVYGTLQDINEKKLSSLALEESENRYRTIFGSSPTGIAIYRLSDGYFISGNAALFKITGRSEEEIRSLDSFDLIPAEYTERLRRNQDQHPSIESFGPLVQEVTSTSGQTVWVLLNGRLFTDQHGERMIYAMCEDISEQHRSAEMLRRKEIMLRSVAASTDEFLSNPDFSDAISRSLPIIGKAVDVDRVYVFKNSFSPEKKISMSLTAEWNSGSFGPQLDNPEMQNIPIDIFGFYLDDLLQKKPFAAIVSQMPAGMTFTTTLVRQDIQSILTIPVFIKDHFWGLVGYDECKYERIWADDEISILKGFSNSISAAIERSDIVKELSDLSLFPKENPDPLFRVDLSGNIVLQNTAAEKIAYLKYRNKAYTLAAFAGMIAKEVTVSEPRKEFEFEHEGNYYLITSLLSGNKIHINNYSSNITELKRSQNELERLSLVAKANRQGVHITDQNYIINYSNQALRDLTGYSSEELKQKPVQELFHGPLTPQEGIAALYTGTEEVHSVDVDTILYRKDRTWFWANVKKQPLGKNANGTQEYFSIIQDISEKKLVEEVLRNSQTRLTSLVQSLKEGILLEDENRKIVLANSKFCSMFRISATPDQITGSDCSQSAEQTKHLFSNPDEFVIRVGQILSDQKPVLQEVIEMADHSFYERDYIPIIINNDSKGHLWKYSDITQRKNQERTLRQQEEKYRNIIANMRMGLLETDNNDTVNYVNHEFCEMSGYTSNEILGMKSVDLLVTEGFRKVISKKNSLRNDGISDLYEVQVKIKNGELRWWLTSGGPNYNDEGILIGTVGISVDITEQKKLQQELEVARMKAEESSRTKEAFLASMSHEIRTPLNAIIGMIREISRDSLTEKQGMYIKNAELASQHLLSIVNDVLDITKIESGQLNLDYGTFNLKNLINDTILILNPAAREKMLRLSVNISRMLAPAYIADASRIKQILINIIGNSIKFTEKGSICVECNLLDSKANSHQILLRISDTGIGMEESFLEHIFDKFSQGDYSFARRSGGTGLGMAITYELVQIMQGKITIRSKKNVGTTTEIRFNLQTGSESDVKQGQTATAFDSLRDKRILLVEDSDLNRMVALNSLVYHGLQVTEAVHGGEAVELLKHKSFDAVLMDLQMPVMGGIEATIVIRREMQMEIPIIALTAHAFKAEIERCLSAGMNDYIIKPFDEDTLLSVLHKNIKASVTADADAKPDHVPDPGRRLYDLDTIEKMSRGNKEFIKRIVQVFNEQTPASVDEIKKALSAGNLETVRMISHRIKPNIDNFGISDLKKDIREIEELAGAGMNTPQLEAMVKKLDEIIKRVVEQLENLEI